MSKTPKRLWYFDTLLLIDVCVQNGILSEQDGCIFVYRVASGDDNEFQEGWYLESYEMVASELMSDENGIKTLIEALAEKGVTFTPKFSKMFSEIAI